MENGDITRDLIDKHLESLPSAEDQPLNWRKALDEESGSYYTYNVVTGEVKWLEDDSVACNDDEANQEDTDEPPRFLRTGLQRSYIKEFWKGVQVPSKQFEQSSSSKGIAFRVNPYLLESKDLCVQSEAVTRYRIHTNVCGVEYEDNTVKKCAMKSTLHCVENIYLSNRTRALYKKGKARKQRKEEKEEPDSDYLDEEEEDQRVHHIRRARKATGRQSIIKLSKSLEEEQREQAALKEELQRLEHGIVELFNLIDTSGDGYVSVKEISQGLFHSKRVNHLLKINKALAQLKKKTVVNHLINSVLALKDKSGDVDMDSFTKLLKALLNPHSPELVHMEYRKMFLLIDKDGDGTLDIHEFHDALRNDPKVILLLKRTPALQPFLRLSTINKLKEIFTLYDSDGSASLSWEEFLNLCTKSVAQMPHKTH